MSYLSFLATPAQRFAADLRYLCGYNLVTYPKHDTETECNCATVTVTLWHSHCARSRAISCPAWIGLDTYEDKPGSTSSTSLSFDGESSEIAAMSVHW